MFVTFSKKKWMFISPLSHIHILSGITRDMCGVFQISSQTQDSECCCCFLTVFTALLLQLWKTTCHNRILFPPYICSSSRPLCCQQFIVAVCPLSHLFSPTAGINYGSKLSCFGFPCRCAKLLFPFSRLRSDFSTVTTTDWNYGLKYLWYFFFLFA